MRIQERQGYNIILHVDSDDYYKAKFSITYNIKDIDGLWKTLQVVSDSLSNIEIDPNNKLIYKNQLVEDIVNLKKIEFAKEQEEIRKKREEELKKAIKRREEMQKILQKQKKTASYNQPEREEVIKNKPLSKVPPIRVDNSKWTKERYETECPKCGGRLVERNSYKGAFIGCRNYPACDFTRETAKKK